MKAQVPSLVQRAAANGTIAQEGNSARQLARVLDEKLDQKILSPKNGFQRYLLLFLVTVPLFAHVICSELPTQFQPQIEKEIFGYDINDQQKAENALRMYSFLKTVGEVPVIFTMFFSGFFIHKVGAYKSFKILTFLMLLGQLLFSLSSRIGGGWTTQSTLMCLMIGRLIQTVSSSSIFIAQSVIIDQEFYEHGFALAIGVRTMMTRFVTFSQGIIMHRVYDLGGKDLLAPFLFSALVCLLAFASSVLFLPSDSENKNSQAQSTKKNDAQSANHQSIKQYVQNYTNKMVRLPSEYWSLCIVSTILFSIFVSTGFTMGDFLHHRFQIGNRHMGFLMAIPSLISAFLAPLIAYIAEKRGQRHIFLLANSFMMTVAPLMHVLLPDCPPGTIDCSSLYYILPLLLLGVGNSTIGGAIYSFPGVVLRREDISIGYGIYLAINKAGNVLAQFMNIQLQINTIGYRRGFAASSLFHVILGICCIIMSVRMYLVKPTKEYLFNKTSGELQKQKQVEAHAKFEHDSIEKEPIKETQSVD